MVESIRRLIGNELRWTQPSMHRYHELVSRDKVYGSLRFGSTFGSLATAECELGRFTLKRQGFLQPSVSVRPIGSEAEHCRLVMDGWHRGGVIFTATGERYQFLKQGFLTAEWNLLNDKRQILFRIHARWGLKYNGQIFIELFGKDDPNVPLFFLLCMYAIILMNDETAAATAGY